jgi:hypothetical protein
MFFSFFTEYDVRFIVRDGSVGLQLLIPLQQQKQQQQYHDGTFGCEPGPITRQKITFLDRCSTRGCEAMLLF